MSDNSIFREVDEAVRHDQFKALWDKYGIWVLLCALALVVGVAGFKGWTYWQNRQAAESGASFAAALDLEEAGKAVDASDALRALVNEGPRGYRILARFQLAAAAAKTGDKVLAIEAYDSLAADTSNDELISGFAVIQAASLALDDANYEEMSKRLGGLANGNSPWRHSGRELLGFSAYRNNMGQEAEDQFGRILADTSAPLNLRRRADMMLALIVKADAPAAGG